MKTLETKQIDSLKSTFLLELNKAENGNLYVQINQSDFDGLSLASVIKINPIVLSEFIKTLQTYHALIGVVENLKIDHIDDKVKKRIRNYYLKGLPLDELCLIFDQRKELIEMVLINMGIEIIPEKQKRGKTNRK